MFAGRSGFTGTTVRQVFGDVDGQRLVELLDRIYASGAPVTVDLAYVTVLASAGVRALYQIRAQLAVHRQEITIIAPPGSLAAAVLELARLPAQGPRPAL